jgi:hypothetical protein
MKKLKLLIIGTLLFNSLLHAKEKWSFGVIYQPKLTNMFANPNASDFHFGYGYETGLRFIKHISSKLEIDSRMLFQEYNFNYEFSISPPDYNDPFTRDGKMKYVYSYSYLSIPITIRYKLIDKNKVTLGIRGGISLDKFLNKEKEIVYGVDYGSYTETPKLNLSAIVGFPIDFKINEKLGLLFEPQFNSMVLDNENNSAWVSRLYGIGLNFGIIF